MVQQVGALDELRAQRVELDVGHAQHPVVALGEAVVLLPDGVEEGVVADRLLDVTVQHL